jgi:hypothetical protein
MDISPVVRKALDAFPGPITFVAEPPPKWLTPVASLTAAACLLLIFLASHLLLAGTYPLGHWRTLRLILDVGVGVLGTILSVASAVIGLTNIFMPGFLRLDESGFIVRSILRTRVFTWDQVSDFSASSPQGSALVVFTAAKPYLSMAEKFYRGPIAGRNGYLPDEYGFSARDLSQLMTIWQQLALRPRAPNVPNEPAERKRAVSRTN